MRCNFLLRNKVGIQLACRWTKRKFIENDTDSSGKQMIYYATVKILDRHIADQRGLVLINFWAKWNKGSKKMAEVMRRVDALFDEDAIIRVDWDKQKSLVEKFKVLGIPTTLIFANNQEVARYLGIFELSDFVERFCRNRNAWLNSDSPNSLTFTSQQESH